MSKNEQVREIIDRHFPNVGVGEEVKGRWEAVHNHVAREICQVFEPQAIRKCAYCGNVGRDVLQFEAKIGGSDELVTIVACGDIDACWERKRTGRV